MDQTLSPLKDMSWTASLPFKGHTSFVVFDVLKFFNKNTVNTRTMVITVYMFIIDVVKVVIFLVFIVSVVVIEVTRCVVVLEMRCSKKRVVAVAAYLHAS